MVPDLLRRIIDLDESRSEVLFSAIQTVLVSYPEVIFIKDKNLRYLAGSQRFAQTMGKESMAELLGKTDEELLEDKVLAQRYIAQDRALMGTGKDLIGYIDPRSNPDGMMYYSSVSKYVLKDQLGEAIGILGLSRDATNQVKRSQRYQRELSRLFTLPDQLYSAILIDVTDWRLVRYSRRKSGQAETVSLDMDAFCALARDNACESSGSGSAFYREFSRERVMELHEQGNDSLRFEYRRRLADGKEHWVQDDVKFFIAPGTGHLHLVILVRDIDEKKRKEEALTRAALIDEMTGLLNRGAAQRQVEEFLNGEGAKGMHAAFLIDVDDFKQINDTYGHREGDDLLKKLAQGIQRCFRETDIVCRYGGDEFFVLAKNLPGQGAVMRCAEKLMDMVHELRATQVSILTSVSAGISIYPTDGFTLGELFVKADEALYKAKASGKDCAAFAMDGNTLWHANANAMRYEAYNSRMLDRASFIGYISDMESYQLLHVTRAAMKLHGLTQPEDYIGRKCYEIISGLDRPCSFCPNAMLREGSDYRWESHEEHLGKWFDCTSSIIHLDGRSCHLELRRDITERMEKFSDLFSKLTMEDVLIRCLGILVSELDMDTALHRFLETVGCYYAADRAYIVEFKLEKGCMDNSFEWCRPGVTNEIGNLQNLPLSLVDNWVAKFKTEGEFSISSLSGDLTPEAPEYQTLAVQGIESLMAAPLYSGELIVGFIGVDNPSQMQGNLALLRSVAEFIQAELERRRLVNELERMSFTDMLTGLKNRNLYDQMLKRYEQTMPESLGTISVDINGVKGINTFRGHSYGDDVIRKTAEVIKENVSGTVYRTGGDEFAVFKENISKSAFNDELAALHSAFAREREFSVSIGGAWCDGEENLHHLLTQADEQVLAEKQVYYHSVLRDGRQLIRNSSISAQVMQEIESGQFVVYYQPQVDLRTGRIIGAEALVRKKTEEGTLIPPNKFIPFYSAEGVVSHIDLYVLQKSCAALRQWMDAGHTLRLSVNVSRVTLLEPGIVEIICGICSHYQVPASCVAIEVTESISKMDHERLSALIQTLRSRGFSVSLDDFGSQYSNLAVLSAIEFDEVKFDKSLVETLERNPMSRVVMENTLKMCHAFQNTHSLAEGIETQGQLQLLRDSGCDYGQGSLFSWPVSPEQFRTLLENCAGGKLAY